MRIEITVDCVDDTKRIPQGQVISWIVKGEKSRDARIKEVADMIVAGLRKSYPAPRDGRKICFKKKHSE